MSSSKCHHNCNSGTVAEPAAIRSAIDDVIMLSDQDKSSAAPEGVQIDDAEVSKRLKRMSINKDSRSKLNGAQIL